MKLWNLTTFLTVSLLIFSGCVTTTPKPKQGTQIDSSLPVVSLTQNGIVADMKAVGFEWMSVNNPRVEGIYIYRKAIEDVDYRYYDTVKSRFVTHYVDTDVKPQSEYGYYFKTFSKDFESQPSVEIMVKTLPTLESVSWIHSIGDMPRTAKIIWRPHPNQIVKSYIIERKTLSEDKWREISTIKGRLNAEYIDENLKDNYVYKYRIRVVTYNDITSEPSAEVKVVTKALPKSVEEISATKDLPKQIKVSWIKIDVKDFLHFNVYRSDNIDGSYNLITSTKENVYIDDIEKDGKDYFYRVSVVDKDNLESKHDAVSAHGKSLVKPSTPTMVEAKMVGENLQISWKSTDSRVKSFIVTKSAKKGWFNTAKEEFANLKGNTFVDMAVEPSTTYIYNVQSVDQFSVKSDASIDVIFTTSEQQGRIVEPKIQQDEQKADIHVEKAPQKTTQDGVVQPVEDFDMSEL